MNCGVKPVSQAHEMHAMSDEDFDRLCRIILSECGIMLTPVKKVMLTVRLVRRLKALDMPSFRRYIDYVESAAGRKEEMRLMIDAVSTNKTEFFRESEHFNYLLKTAVPTLEREHQRCRLNGVRVWSAGCSSGEEPYTLAMALSEYKRLHAAFQFSILATDISSRVLANAVKGVYPDHAVDNVPDQIRKRYLMKGSGRMAGFHRVVPELRARIVFRRHNLSQREFGMKETPDVIFCRNVIIYLERKVQEVLFDNFHKAMAPGGYLFVGHSETLDGLSTKFKRVAPTIYRRA